MPKSWQEIRDFKVLRGRQRLKAPSRELLSGIAEAVPDTTPRFAGIAFAQNRLLV